MDVILIRDGTDVVMECSCGQLFYSDVKSAENTQRLDAFTLIPKCPACGGTE